MNHLPAETLEVRDNGSLDERQLTRIAAVLRENSMSRSPSLRWHRWRA